MPSQFAKPQLLCACVVQTQPAMPDRRFIHRLARVIGLLGLIVLIAAGCSSSNAADTETSQQQPPAETVTVVAAATPTPLPPPTSTPEGSRPVLIATVLGETGVMAPQDATALSGIMAMVERLNDDGGVDDRDVELRRFDINSRASQAARIADRLIDMSPDLVVVSCDMTYAAPVLDVASEQQWLTMSACDDDVGYISAAHGPLAFTWGAPEDSRGRIAADAAFSRYGPTAMVLRDRTTPEGLAFCDGFEQRFAELGGLVLYSDSFTFDTLDPLQDRIAEEAVPTAMIVLCSHLPGRIAGAPSVIALVRSLGFAAPIVSGTGVDQRGWFGSVPQLGELLIVTWSSAFGNDPDPWVNGIIEQANNIDNQALRDNDEGPRVGVSTVNGAEMIRGWALAADRASSVEPNRVAAALASFAGEDFPTGPISFVGGQHMDISRLHRVLEVSGGELSVLGTVESG